jgi:hypothetical protein
MPIRHQHRNRLSPTPAWSWRAWPRKRIHSRYICGSQHDGTVYIDMGDPDCHVIEIAGGTWDIGVRAPVLFRRTKLTGVMPKP